jgi:hypothetical protein
MADESCSVEDLSNYVMGREEDDRSVYVTKQDVEETAEEALRNVAEALVTVLDLYKEEGKPVPWQSGWKTVDTTGSPEGSVNDSI